MKTTPYRLPDGRIVQVDATAAKDAIYIDYQLSGGQIVTATLVRQPPTVHCAWRASKACTPVISEGDPVRVSHGICPACEALMLAEIG